MGVSFASVNRWENKQSRPSPLAWRQIALAEEIGLKAFEPKMNPSNISTPKSDTRQRIDFLADPETVRVVAEGERLTYGFLFNPAFATEISMIDPLPHQRIAVYEQMLNQPRLRFLLADDAGGGKTIMSGLYMREMLTRRLIRRVLIIPPAGLIGNWEREMRTLFGLNLTIIIGADARFKNPFIGPESNLVIVSLDTLHGERMFSRLKEKNVEPYDLVIFDEAHKLSANREPDMTIRKTDRYRLAETLAGIRDIDSNWRLNWSCRHLILLTATPHMGKDIPYYFLWRLLEPEIFSTYDAFRAYPQDARQHYFIRRTKEEMVRLDGSPIYPTRISDTYSYDLTQGEDSEQSLYDDVTKYIQTYYNQGRLLNRSAVRLAMSVFQRRLASSSYALLRSMQNRLKKIEEIINEVKSNPLGLGLLVAQQKKMDITLSDVFDDLTGDEETSEQGKEQNEINEDQILEMIVATTLAQLLVEKEEVQKLVGRAKKVYDNAEESKFEKLCELIRDPKFKNEKFIIFTEFRDTMEFLVNRLEGMGHTGQVARIHGGMDFHEREAQVAFFKKSVAEGGARYLIATDAAGEGINLQFCWISINYDIPWNPARLEQRMGRIHRYGQKHEPVCIFNLVTGKTREGRVLKTLLEKLDRIREELGTDKVFDQIGRVFENISLRKFMEEAVTTEGAEKAEREIVEILDPDKVKAIREAEKKLYGSGDVKPELPRLRKNLEQETYLRLLPGYVRRFVEKASPLLDLKVERDLDGIFSLRGKMDPVMIALESYPPELRDQLTVYKPSDPEKAIFLRPGEIFFDTLRTYVCSRFSSQALKGGVFIDPAATKPYLFHLALVSVERQADSEFAPLANGEILEQKLVGIRQNESGGISEMPIETLLLLKGGKEIPYSAARFAAGAEESIELVDQFILERIAQKDVEKRKAILLQSLPERIDFVNKGYDYQDAELAAARAKLSAKIREGDARAKADLISIKERQSLLYAQRNQAINILEREPKLVQPGEIIFLAHALVVPSDDEEDKKKYDAEIEAIAVKVAWGWEESHGASVKDVSKPKLARAAGLQENPGFDLLSEISSGERRLIEVKGRVGIGDVELTENEWAKACNLRENYWLYVVYDCGTPNPRLLRIRDPFGKLLFRAKSSVVIDESQVLEAAEVEE